MVIYRAEAATCDAVDLTAILGIILRRLTRAHFLVPTMKIGPQYPPTAPRLPMRLRDYNPTIPFLADCFVLPWSGMVENVIAHSLVVEGLEVPAAADGPTKEQDW